MTRLTTNTVEIRRNIEDVFSYVSDMEKYGEWFPGVIDVKAANDRQKKGPGKKYIETHEMPFNRLEEITIETKQFIENTLFITEGNLKGFWPRMTIKFEEKIKGETTVTRYMDSRNNSLFTKIFLSLFLKRKMIKMANTGMENLKRRLESDRTAEPVSSRTGP